MNETNILLHKIVERLDIRDSKMDHLIKDVSEMKGDISYLKSDVSDLKTDVSSLTETQQRHDEMLEKLVKGQEKQNLILKSLALRSIEQETEIDALKFITSK